MKKTLLALALLPFTLIGILSTQARAQSDTVVIEVAGQQIGRQEFMRNFMQTVGDNLAGKPGVTEAEKRQALDEYVELYANFRAKVADARAMGFDTTADLRSELARYRAELAAPYLIDSAMLSKIMREAYARNRYALHAAHILVRVGPDAAPADTQQAYGRAMHLYRRATEGGENFFSLAAEEVRRHNPDAKVSATEGELNYFTSFNMVYPFENAAYALEVGEISKPVRSRYGYHVIKLFDKVPFYGKVTLQHIWLRNPNSKAAIGMAYERLQNGTPFEMVARESEDYSTAETGGYITDATMSQLPHEYIKVLSSLQEGEISSPFYTRYGWHIVKLVKKEEIPPYEAMVPYYKQKLARDPRGEASRKAFAEASRKKYGIVDYTVTPAAQPKGKRKQPVEMMASLDELTAHMNDSIFRDLWRYKADEFHDLRPLVHTPTKDYNVLDLARYIRRNQRPQLAEAYGKVVRRYYDNFLDSVTVVYADSRLEAENPEFDALVEDYRRGLMIFNYNDKMIWSKAIYDTVGFADFYARDSKTKSLANPADSIYFWRTRARVIDLHVADSLCLAPEKAYKLITKALQKGKSSSEMRSILESKVNSKKCSSDTPVVQGLELVEQTRQNLLADDQWKRGVYASPEGKGYRLLVVEDILPPMLKQQMEARGYYLNSWQNEVEQKLMQELRVKYNVKIHRDVVREIVY